MYLTADEYTAISNLYAKYNVAGDIGRPEDYGDCYALEGVLLIDGQEVQRGRDALVEFIRARQTARGGKYRRHFNSGLYLTKVGEGAARGQCYLQIFSGEKDLPPVLAAMCSYDDEIVLEGGEWRFARRNLVNDYKNE
jgi:hypothetical protein